MPIDPSSLSCPLPIMDHDTIQLAHGSGGRLSADLIDKLFLPRLGNTVLNKLEDQALLECKAGVLSFSTDSFVVDPIFFPGGNIGDLAINGTVNDVCMGGAKPEFISAAFIIEEGLPIADLHRILVSMEKAANDAGVKVVTGDTKVVNHGSCDKIFITTTGIGFVRPGVNLSASNIQPGDVIILSGTLADHGMAVMTSRENLSFKSKIQSDTAALNGLVEKMLNTSTEIRALRDPTRGGLATTLNEFASSSKVGLEIIEEKIPVTPQVRGACEVLGIDPLYVANEGKLVAIVPEVIADEMLAAMRSQAIGKNAEIIGRAVEAHPGIVTINTLLGANRIVDMPVGEQLPRIC